MRRFIQTYRYVRFVNSKITKYEKENSTELFRSSKPGTINVVTFEGSVAIAEYAAKRHITVHEAQDISKYACQRNYLDVGDLPGKPKAALSVSTRGRDILDVPIGTLQCLGEDSGKGITYTAAILIAVIPNLGHIENFLRKII